MKTFAEFYQRGVVTGDPIPACGDRSIIILDGRNLPIHWVSIAREECAKRRYIGFTINRGSFSNSRITRELEII